MKFSYIIPTYNRKDLLLKTIDSVLCQNHNDYEIVVIDDGSSDGTDLIEFSSISNKIRYFKQINSGVSSARNYGAKLSKGRYLIFLDSDDLVFNEQLACFDKMIVDNPQCSMFFTSYFFWDSSSDLLKKREDLKEGIYNDFFLDCTKSIQPFFPGCFCISKILFEESNKFEVGCNFGEDQKLWVELMSSSLTASSNLATFKYRVDSIGSLSKFKVSKLPPDINSAIEIYKDSNCPIDIKAYIVHRLVSFLKMAIKNVDFGLMKCVLRTYIRFLR